MKFPGAFAIALVAGCAALPARAGETELWITADQKREVGRTVTLDLMESVRFRGDGTGRYYWFGEAGLTVKPGPGWSMQPSLRLARLRSSGGRWGDELRGAISATRVFESPAVRFSARGRLEYREYSARTDGWWIRGRAHVSAGSGWRQNWKPYLSEEVFHGFDSGGIRQNRVFAGATIPVGRAVAEVYFGWKSGRSGGSWVHDRVFGLKAGWKF